MSAPYTTANSLSFSLGDLLGCAGEKMPKERYQEPTLQQTSRGVWFIRPWVDKLLPDGKLGRAKETIPIGAMGKREAQAIAREKMRTINKADYVITSQIPVGAFLDEYLKLHVEKLSPGAKGKYTSLIKNYIRKRFGDQRMMDLQTLPVQSWLDTFAQPKENGEPRLSWATRTDIRNVLSSMFSKAIEWGRWKDRNPIEHVHAGRRRAAREKRKVSDDDMRKLLASCPHDVRLAVCVGLFCTLRVSETLGLQEKHLDFERGVIQVRQRWYRGHLDQPKNDNAKRDVPMGYLAGDLKAICTGNPERYVFEIKTHRERKSPTICRDDRDLNQHFLRPEAKRLGFYWKGFGWHAFRREAVTAISASIGIGQAMKLAGHAKADMSLLYTMADHQTQDAAIKARQSALIGETGEKVQ